MAKRGRRAPTLRSLARRLRTLFTAKAHRKAGEWTDRYLKAAAEAGWEVRKEGAVPWEVYAIKVTISYDAADGSGSTSAVVELTAPSGSGEPNDARRAVLCADAAQIALEDWAAKGLARYIMSASWSAGVALQWDGEAPDPWHGDGDLMAGDYDPVYIHTEHARGVEPRPKEPTRRMAGSVWRVTRRSTMRHEKVRRRNRPGSGPAGSEVEDWM